MRKTYILFYVCTAISFGAFSQQNIENEQTKTTFHILFVGNSLTYTNNLPDLVKQYAKKMDISIVTKTLAYPNYAIEDHWNDGQVQKLISTNTYDFVIIQQGPSSQSDGRQMLLDYGKKYKALCKLHEAKLCFFMVWPSLQYYHTFDGVIKNYSDAALANSAILLPVGKVWKNDMATDANKTYYGTDGFHPSHKGSKIAAKVIVEHLFN